MKAVIRNSFRTFILLRTGTASRLSPFDSAIFMSKDAGNSESFKLYARKINNFHCTLTCHDFLLATAPASVSMTV